MDLEVNQSVKEVTERFFCVIGIGLAVFPASVGISEQAFYFILFYFIFNFQLLELYQ